MLCWSQGDSEIMRLGGILYGIRVKPMVRSWVLLWLRISATINHEQLGDGCATMVWCRQISTTLNGPRLSHKGISITRQAFCSLRLLPSAIVVSSMRSTAENQQLRVALQDAADVPLVLMLTLPTAATLSSNGGLDCSCLPFCCYTSVSWRLDLQGTTWVTSQA